MSLQWHRGRGAGAGCKNVDRKDIFTLKFTQPGWTEQSKLVSECILNLECNISLCRLMKCMSKLQVIFIHMQCENSK